MSEFIAQPAFDIGRRLEIRGLDSGAWFVIASAVSDNEAIENFKIEVEATANLALTVLNVSSLSLEDLLSSVYHSGTGGVLMWDFESFDQARWGAWDINRSRFVRSGPMFLWLSFGELSKFCEYAPNLKSFVGGSFFTLSPSGEPLSDAERNQRIRELEQHFGLSSSTVIGNAEKGILPPDPHFAEWLILLDRGDLV